MKIKLDVFFTDGGHDCVEFDKPSGALPLSISSYAACVAEAEKGGRIVERVCRISPVLKIERDALSREQIEQGIAK